MQTLLVYEVRGGLPRTVTCESIRALVAAGGPPLSGVSVWCRDARHLHYPDGHWHPADAELEWVKAEMRKEAGGDDGDE